MKKMNIVINKNGIKFGIFIFLFMWIYFLLENIFPSLKYLIGIEPRVFSLRIYSHCFYHGLHMKI